MQRFTLRATAVLIAHMALAVPAFAYSEATFLQDDRLSADIYRTGDVQGALPSVTWCKRRTLRRRCWAPKARWSCDFGQNDAAPGLAMAVTEAGVSFAVLPYGISSYVKAVADVRAGISLELGTRGAAPLLTLAVPRGKACAAC